ncbi:MAG TPA: T9SS type A sorting domain-containing protein, partial [Flavobacteriales bacterium]|nr:T9SS type A sorting domain-containing protein [Flavobacteriales bacterium]
ADGYFGKDYSLSGWNCSISNIDNAAKSISISPNPTHGQFTIDIKGHQGPIDVEVYDLSGRLLQSTNSTTISLKDYPSGIYSFKVSYGERVKEIKVVKE